MKRSFLYAGLAAIVVAVALVMYFFVFQRADRVSPVVSITSYEQSFQREAASRAGASFASLPASKKLAVIGDILADGSPAARVAAVRHIADAGEERGVAEVLRKALRDTVVEVAEEAVALFGKPAFAAHVSILEAYRDLLRHVPESSVPLSGLGYVGGYGGYDGEDVAWKFREFQGGRQALDDSLAYEINLFLPRGADAYFSFPNFDDWWEEFTGGDFARELFELKAYEDLKKVRVLSALFAVSDKFSRELGPLGGFLTPDALFQDDVKLALFGTRALVVTFAGKNAEVARALLPLMAEKGDMRVEKEYEDGVEIQVLRKGGRTVAAVSVRGGYLVAGNDLALVRNALDAYARPVNSIASLPAFQQAYGKLDVSGDDHFGFVFFRPAVLFEKESRLGGSGYLLRLADRVLERKKKPRPVLDGLRALPSFLGSVACFRGVSFTDAWRYLMDVRAYSSRSLDSLQELAGVDVAAQLVPNLGDEMIVALEGVEEVRTSLARTFLPLGVIGFEIARPDSFRPAFRKFTDALLRQPARSLEYRGQVMFVAASNEDEMEDAGEQKPFPSYAPCYAVLGNTLIIASGPELMSRVIDTYRGDGPRFFREPVNEAVGGFFQERTGVVLKSLLAFFRKYSARTQRFTYTDVRDGLAPFFGLLSENNSIHGWWKERGGVLEGAVTLDMK